MPDLLSEQEFTERFTEAISKYKLTHSCKEPLMLELHYGADEPILTISLKDAFMRYSTDPDRLDEFLQPYVQDIGWTVQDPRYASNDIYKSSMPILRNLIKAPLTDDEGDSGDSPKGPIVFDQVLKTANETIVMQFKLCQDESSTSLRKGDTLRCIPDVGLLAKLTLHNLALFTEGAGITATPLQFESLKARAYFIGLGDDKQRDSIAALSCIPPVMASLEETFRARDGLIAIMPAVDQLIVSIDTSDECICELGVLAQQLLIRAPNPLSELIWTYREGTLEAVQALELDEVQEGTGAEA